MSRFVALGLLLGYVAIPLLIFFGVLPFEHKFVFLVTYGVLVYLVLRCVGAKNAELGLTTKNWQTSLASVLGITLFFVVAALVAYKLIGARFEPTETLLFYLFYVFISSPVQEFLYRGATSYFGKTLGLSVWLTVLISAMLYSLVHVIYKDWVLVVATFILGIIWHLIYLKTDNLLGVSISHAIFGALTIFLGLI